MSAKIFQRCPLPLVALLLFMQTSTASAGPPEVFPRQDPRFTATRGKISGGAAEVADVAQVQFLESLRSTRQLLDSTSIEPVRPVCGIWERAKRSSRGLLLRLLGINKPGIARFLSGDAAFLSLTEQHLFSIEDGSVPLRALQISFVQPVNGDRKFLDEALAFVMATAKAQLWVVYGPGTHTNVADWYLSRPSEQRERIRIFDAESSHSRFGRVQDALLRVAGESDELYAWAQDGSKPGPNHALVMPSRAVDGRTYAYRRPAQLLDAAHLAKTRVVPIYFEGGNIIVGARHVFVGVEIIDENMSEAGTTRARTLARLADLFGAPVVELGVPRVDVETGLARSFHQRHFHIDLTIALLKHPDTGKEVVLLNDIREGLKALFGFDVLAQAKSDEHFSDLLGDTLLDWMRHPSENEKHEAAVLGYIKTNSYVQLMKEALEADYIRRQIEALGYEVIGLPGVGIFSYTNIVASEGKVWGPHFGVAGLDHAAVKIFRDQGFKYFGSTYGASAMVCVQGGPRCLSQTFRTD